MSAVLDGGMPKYLITKASQIGYCFGKLVRDILKLHAFINMRKAQGLISIAEKYGSDLVEEAAEMAIQKRLSVTPKSFKILIEKRQSKKQENNQIEISEQTERFVRGMEYFIQTRKGAQHE